MTSEYSQISRDFMRALRGRRSQAAFSRRLGYRTNVAYIWESGRAAPTAATALHAASRVGIDVRQALSAFYRRTPAWLEEVDPSAPDAIAKLLDDLRGRTSLVDLAASSGKSRFAIARWLSGAAEPRLPDFFLMIEKTSLRLLDFIASFTDPLGLPSTAQAWRELEATRHAAYSAPWTQAVLRVLELTDYQRLAKHEPGWVATRIGISRSEEDRCLELLARTGQIHEKGGRWQVRQVLAVDTRRDADAERSSKAWWGEVALARLKDGDAGMFSHNIFAVSAADLARINDLYRATFRQIRSIIAESEPSERVVLFNLQLLPLDRR
jgi:transcriptional regulator with XRE-family HTH domain